LAVRVCCVMGVLLAGSGFQGRGLSGATGVAVAVITHAVKQKTDDQMPYARPTSRHLRIGQQGRSSMCAMPSTSSTGGLRCVAGGVDYVASSLYISV
jgi:hypothetical protein